MPWPQLRGQISLRKGRSIAVRVYRHCHLTKDQTFLAVHESAISLPSFDKPTQLVIHQTTSTSVTSNQSAFTRDVLSPVYNTIGSWFPYHHVPPITTAPSTSPTRSQTTWTAGKTLAHSHIPSTPAGGPLRPATVRYPSTSASGSWVFLSLPPRCEGAGWPEVGGTTRGI